MWKLLLGLLVVVHQCNAHITKQEFTDCVTACGYRPPNPDIYEHFEKATKDFKREELAMFLAQLIHESGGFQYKEEIQFVGNNWHTSYKDNVGLPGKTYHGRGYIQLTWGANYKACSEDLGMGDYLLRNPEVVASSTELAVKVSVWYWVARVRPQMRGKENQFGCTTKAINGALECNRWNERAANRYKLYLNVANVLKIKKKAVENGCYN